MTIEKNWKYYLGITLFTYSLVPYVTVVFLPFLHLSHAGAITVAAGLVVSAEISFFLSAVLLGKPFVEFIKERIKGYLLRKKVPAPAAHISKLRHYTGITLLFLSFLPYYATLAILLFGDTDTRVIHLIVGFMLAGEALFIAGLFVLGGEFWERLKKLFEWPGKAIADNTRTSR